ncbi:MAG: transketolase, partial [Propionibacteriaceae bacterium]|nr:transketolase [Propionibacteriaceae bacterium]
VATGSEVEVAVEARDILELDGIPTRVISAPCLEWYAEQPESYKRKLFPANTVLVSVEAGVRYGWAEIVGTKGIRIGIDHFGASASAAKLFSEYGIEAENVAAQAKEALGQS